MKISELVYESLIGELVDPIKDVPNAFEDGSYCDGQYRRMLKAYERVRERLGVEDEDADVEIIIGSLLAIQRELRTETFDLAHVVT